MKVKELPTFTEALKMKKEIEIIKQQGIEKFLERMPKLIIQEIERTEKELLWRELILMNYGYIMGVRAERAKRKKVNK